jgi:hypothetical protein
VHTGDDAPIPSFETDIIMNDREDRARLAREVLGFAEGML